MSTLLRPAPEPSRPLEGRYATPPRADGLRPTPATMELVRGQVRALLLASPSWTAMPDDEQKHIERKLVRIAGYAAECLREMCWQSEMLGQTPVLKPRKPPKSLARAQAQPGDFSARAASQIGRVTEQTLKAIAFPTFVSDLIRGTFNAIVQTSIQQLEAFAALLDNVSKTVDQFTSDNISDNQARDWLAQRYPDHITIDGGQAVVREGAEDKALPDFRRDLNLRDTVSSLDETTLEETLIPAARRRLAETRLQILSSLVLMGVNRIIVSGGKIRATMGFHIDTTDKTHEEHATDFDFRHQASFRYGDSWGFSPWSASASHSVAYVTSTRRQDDSEIDVASDLTGEVELHFKTDHIPLDRFATGPTIGRIQGNTANPDANTPVGVTPPAPFSEAPQVGGDVVKSKVPERKPRPEPQLAPPAKNPLAEQPKMPTKVTPVEKDEQMTDQQKIKLEEERRKRKEKGELVPEADPTLKVDEKSKGDQSGGENKAEGGKGKGAEKKVEAGKGKPNDKAGGKPDAQKSQTENKSGTENTSETENTTTEGDSATDTTGEPDATEGG